MQRIFLLLIGLLFSLLLRAQLTDNNGEWVIKDSSSVQIADLPWTQSQIKNVLKDSSYTHFMKSLTEDVLFEMVKGKSFLSVSPEILLNGSYEPELGENFFAYGGGGRLQYLLNDKFSLKTRIYGFQQDALAGDSIRGVNNLMPGAYKSNYVSGIMSYFDFRMRMAYEPSKYFHFEAGIDNHFVGDGYHSILMGNNVSPYPFAMISTSFWKIDYNVQYHFLKDVAYPDLSKVYNKYMTTHQLNFRATPKLHFYILEAVVWKQEDSVVNRGYDMSYLNPIIFFRPVEFQLGNPSPDNVLIGFGFRYQPLNWFRFYGQGLLDEFYLKEIQAQNGWWANKFAFQIGFESKFSVSDHFFKLQAEYNMARPYTYSHIGSMQNYGHRLYSLAHPLGANFGEALFCAGWNYKNISLDAKIAAIMVGTDESDINYGQNIYRSYIDRESEYGHSWLQGNLQKDISADIRAGYVINKALDLNLSVGLRSYPSYSSSAIDAQRFNEFYVRISTFTAPRMKDLYRTTGLYE